MRELIYGGIRYFAAGGALGFDTMAAQTVLKLRQDFPFIQLILVLPFREQATGWEEDDKKTYNQILRRADRVVYTTECYYNGCFQKRNRYLIERSLFCLCYLTDAKSGTAYTVNQAEQKGLYVIILRLSRKTLSLKNPHRSGILK